MTGNLLIAITIIVTGYLFTLAKIYNPETIRLWSFLAQISGLFGSVLISLNFILAIRSRIIEKVFDGLDKAYKVHNKIGNIALILAVNHPLFLIINSLPFNTSKLYLVPNISNPAYFFGILTLYTLIVLVSITIFIDLPYKFWKKTHELMGLVIIFGSLHSFLIISDVSTFLPLRIWILGFNFVALTAYFYKRYFYYFFRPKNNYIVKKITHDKNYLIIDLTVADNSKLIHFNPGQFAFFSLAGNKRDEHPFSILEESDKFLKIGTKVIGKFTLSLTELKSGDLVSVNGPFGTFAGNLHRSKEMVWISGGIGITPFLSMIKSLKPDQTVTMVHSTKSSESGIFSDLFKNYAYYFPNFNFNLHFSDLTGRLNENLIASYASLTENTHVYMCGPNKMMEYISHQLPKKGIKRKRIIFEDFNLK